MASSRASTSAVRRRSKAKSAPRTRAKPKPKKSLKPKSAKPKPKKSLKPTSAKPKPKKPPKRKIARPRPKTAKPAPPAGISRALTIALAVASATIALAVAYLFWFRDSSFVAVEKVTVEGTEGPEAEEVREALTRAGQNMTTLHVDEGELVTAVSRFPTVVAIRAEPDFPHALTIQVTSRPPVVSVSDGGPPVTVAEDGTLLHGVEAAEGSLPALEVDSVPAKGKLTGEPLALAAVAGAAPDPLRPLIEGLSFSEAGIEVVLEGEIPVKFGDPDEAEAKWGSVAAVLANPQVKTLTHLDVRVPERPSIGGAAKPPAPEE